MNQTLQARPLILVDVFPRLSETFIVNEIEDLYEAGAGVSVFALSRPSDSRGSTADTWSRQPENVAIRFSSGAWADSRLARPSWSDLRRHVSILFAMFWTHPRWLAYGIARTFTVLHAARMAREVAATSIHAHFLGAPTVIGVCAAAVARLPFSLSPHASLWAFAPSVTRRVLGRAAFAVACWRGAESILLRGNQCTLEADIASGLRGSDVVPRGARVFFVPHGIECPTREPKESRNNPKERPDSGPSATDPKSDPKVLRLLFVGRLVPKKGVRFLLEALRDFEDPRGTWALTIVGDGEGAKEVSQIVETHPARDRIRWLGSATHVQVREFLRSADVLVVPSVPFARQTEGRPNIILEAFAEGVVVVASRTGGIPEIVQHGATGLLVEPGHVEDLRAVLRTMFDSPETRRVIALAAHRFVQIDHDPLAATSRLLDLHRSVMEQS